MPGGYSPERCGSTGAAIVGDAPCLDGSCVAGIDMSGSCVAGIDIVGVAVLGCDAVQSRCRVASCSSAVGASCVSYFHIARSCENSFFALPGFDCHAMSPS